MTTTIRYRPANVTPLEIWDVAVGANVPLHKVAADARAAAVVHVVLALRAGRARRIDADTPLPAVAFDDVVVGGGDAGSVLLALHAHGISTRMAPHAAYIGEAGGRRILRDVLRVDGDGGVVVDVGQSAVKVSRGRTRTRVERNVGDVPDRAAAVAFIAGAFAAKTKPAGIVLALPCEIDDACAAADCSYPWPKGDASLVDDVLAAAGCSDVPCAVLNDAELAALSVAQSMPPSVPQSAPTSTTLVLTIGFGVGAALLGRQR